MATKAEKRKLKKDIEEENRRNPESRDFTGHRIGILILIGTLIGIMFYGIFAG